MQLRSTIMHALDLGTVVATFIAAGLQLELVYDDVSMLSVMSPLQQIMLAFLACMQIASLLLQGAVLKQVGLLPPCEVRLACRSHLMSQR